MNLSEEDFDELIAMADRSAASFGGNPDWTWPQTALGRAIVALMGRTPTRFEVLTAQRRHADRVGEEIG